MSTEDKSKKMADEYGKKAKEAMDRVTDDQPPEVKERVDKVQNAVEKTIDSTKDAVS
ncbi:CsbD family protein [Pleurocapsa sp. CCALA 161]|uniref:CsbD family protein n=1 Tax=Pleurocapsa sp. CCALA 161 TaxID=2107688 RepID=UPI000D08235F|nr:CsbD family protein [Pleurocapsa sp. CCALA 161]PSB10721.1 CsbD family protein [Pleurocapsa sp. CCALA 161]